MSPLSRGDAALLRTAIVLVLGVASASCSKDGRPGVDSTRSPGAGASTSPTPIAARTAPANCATNDGQLHGYPDNGSGTEIAGADLPTSFDASKGDSQVLPNGIKLKITPVAHVGSVWMSCIAKGYGYVVAKIEYADNGTALAWPNWKRDGRPAYVYVLPPKSNDAAKPDFQYFIRLINPAGNASAVLHHGYGFAYGNNATPNTAADQAKWGIPAWHQGDTAYDDRLKAVSGMPHLSAGIRAKVASRPGEKPDSDDRRRDYPPGAWFACDQGCCTTTDLFQ